MLKRILKSLPVVREIRELRDSVKRLTALADVLQNQATNGYATALLNSEKYKDPKRVTPHEAQVYSQSGEDGIIAEIFRRIGTTNRAFAEVGVGNGLENNTVFLLSQGWVGAWIDGDQASASSIRKTFYQPISTKQLSFIESFVTAENIADLFSKLSVPRDLDLLSLDIDRNTYWIWHALKDYRARLVVVEYNATWPADCDWKMPYDTTGVWDGSMNFGASLKAFERLGNQFGYSLVGCDLGGANAFFVRDDLLKDHFASPYTAENHYEPARYWLARRNGHPRSF